MLGSADCRLDELAAQYGTPVLVVAEAALRQRARDYRETLTAAGRTRRSCSPPRPSRARLCNGFSSPRGCGSTSPAVAKSSVRWRRVRTRPRSSCTATPRPARSSQLAVEHGLGTVVVDNLDDIDRLDALVPAGRIQACLVRVVPGVQATTHPAYATGHEGSKFGLLPAAAREAIARIEAASAPADGRAAHPRRVAADGRGRAGCRGRTAGGVRRVRGVRPRWRPRGPLHLRRQPTEPGRVPRRPDRRRSRAPAVRRPDPHRARPEHGLSERRPRSTP